MKKLNILIALVDFLWFVTCIPLALLAIFFSVYIFINKQAIELLHISGENIAQNDWKIQLLVVLTMVLVLIFVYSFYLFRNTLRYFRRRKPFDDFVINMYNHIGNILFFSGIVGAVLSFTFSLYLTSKLTISLGTSPYLFVICLGLFFMVLSETFKIAKIAKQENELTI